jgi:L-lactate utilization protein LutC
MGVTAWEKFLRDKADLFGLEGAERKIFMWVYSHEEYRDFKTDQLVEEYIKHVQENKANKEEFKGTSFKTHLTKIFEKVGHDSFQTVKYKRRQLYDRLRKEFDDNTIQQEARSSIPPLVAEHLHEAIAKLNYLEQEQAFQVALTSPKVAQALLVRVDDLDMQKWLTWRLMHVFKDVQGKPEAEKPPCYTTKANWSWAPDLEEFWQWLANKISCTYKSPKQMIQAVVEACKHSSLVIVVREISCLKPDVLASFVTDFWQPLTNQLNTDSRRFRQGRCLLFLTDEAKYKCSTSFPFLTEFAAWETVNQADLELWLERDPVTKMLGEAKQKPGEDLASICLGALKDQRPMTVIQRLAEVMGLANGIEDLVNYWDIGVV